MYVFFINVKFCPRKKILQQFFSSLCHVQWNSISRQAPLALIHKIQGMSYHRSRASIQFTKSARFWAICCQ